MNKYFLRLAYITIVSLIMLTGIMAWRFFPQSKLQIPFTLSSTISPSPVPLSPPIETTKVIRVIDGDTIEIENKKTVRYIGIDTPETKHPVKGVECFGKEASDFNKNLVEGKYIRIQKDVSETDKYKRLLRYVWLIDSPTASQTGIFVNDYLVRQGYAYAATFPPDVTYSKQFMNAAQEAREKKRGLWGKCDVAD